VAALGRCLEEGRPTKVGNKAEVVTQKGLGISARTGKWWVYWSRGGETGPRQTATQTREDSIMNTLITGGAGFIGYNYAMHRVGRGDNVVVIDSCTRKGSKERFAQLDAKTTTIKSHLQNVNLVHILKEYEIEAVIHLAGQTAVTRSIIDPFKDYYDNLQCTVHLLETIRKNGKPFPQVIYSSTNKVYGPETCCEPIDEYERIDLKTPYAVSKGAADFYMQEYGRQYGIPTIILRQSCIYGPHQTAESDQGWVMHFINQSLQKKPITIFGDGFQIRDVLYIEDLTLLYDLLLDIPIQPGRVFNVGGGLTFSVSLHHALHLIWEHTKATELIYDEARPDDQNYYVSDNATVIKATGWSPYYSPKDGIGHTIRWINETRNQEIHE